LLLFIAYAENVAGRIDVSIRPFRGPDVPTPVSVGGGREPVWGRNGELFYRRRDDDAMMAVRVTTTPTLTVGPPIELFKGPGNPGGTSRANYDVTSDGQRFIMSAARVADAHGAGGSIQIVLNWVEELKQRLPQ
jgi:hypothetical protein